MTRRLLPLAALAFAGRGSEAVPAADTAPGARYVTPAEIGCESHVTDVP